MNQALWIGGPPGSGKTTVAECGDPTRTADVRLTVAAAAAGPALAPEHNR